MPSMMDSLQNTHYISHSSPAPALHSSFSDSLCNPDLESSPFPESQQNLPIDPSLNKSLPTPSVNENSNPTVLIDDIDLDIISTKHGTNKCVQYPERQNFTTESRFIQKRNEFMRWWKTTTAAGKFNRKGQEMRWGGSKHSQGWQHFIEVARLDDGTPRARCIHCESFIDHPGRGNGTKTMIRHPKTRQCSYHDPEKHPASITKFFRQGSVSAQSTSRNYYAKASANLGFISFLGKYTSPDLLS